MDSVLTAPANDFGTRLQEAIKARGLTDAELARQAMISRWTIRNWVNGRNRPEMDKLRRLAHVLGVRSEDLLGIEPEDEAVDSMEKFFVWLAQMQYQITVHARTAIEGEVQRRLVDYMQGNMPTQDGIERAATELVRSLGAGVIPHAAAPSGNEDHSQHQRRGRGRPRGSHNRPRQ